MHITMGVLSCLFILEIIQFWKWNVISVIRLPFISSSFQMELIWPMRTWTLTSMVPCWLLSVAALITPWPSGTGKKRSLYWGQKLSPRKFLRLLSILKMTSSSLPRDQATLSRLHTWYRCWSFIVRIFSKRFDQLETAFADVNIRILFKCIMLKTNYSATFLVGYGDFITENSIDKRRALNLACCLLIGFTSWESLCNVLPTLVCCVQVHTVLSDPLFSVLKWFCMMGQVILMSLDSVFTCEMRVITESYILDTWLLILNGSRAYSWSLISGYFHCITHCFLFRMEWFFVFYLTTFWHYFQAAHNLLPVSLYEK